MLTTFKGLASYLIPKVDVQVAGTFSSRPGVSLLANQVYTSAQVANPAFSTLGRPLAQVATVTVNLIEPNTVFGDRIDQLDLRIGKLLRFGRTRTVSQRGHRQRVELERQPRVQPDVQRDVADADQRDHREAVPPERAVRLLELLAVGRVLFPLDPALPAGL